MSDGRSEHHVVRDNQAVSLRPRAHAQTLVQHAVSSMGNQVKKKCSPPSLPPIIRVCGLGFNRGFAGGALEMHARVFFVGFGGELSESRPCLHEFWLSVPYAGFCVSLSWARPIRFALV